MEYEFHLNVLSDGQKRLADVFSREAWLGSFYLAGGTSLALQLGHRQSIDFDFFTKDPLPSLRVKQKLSDLARFELFAEDKDTIHGTLNGIKISFFNYPYELLKKPLSFGSMLLADLLDIALMKLEAVSGRGSKKDFVDLYFLLQRFSLQELISPAQVPLVYFEDAEPTPMPVMLRTVSWDDVKDDMRKKIKNMKW